ncbi:hypothetical protein [Halorarum salinum]|uniref:DUF2238 domain-containing protein n=1 Tax=Halorarum salinum TaxID=2743089 RepID=A0A7D5LBI3_9EURY|nr:hypothetical protein [Halobaculum salinum]QLG62594.1 hypothetical protein HUG12_13025 [Halobaculum salinum]
MTLGDVLGFSDPQERVFGRILQLVLLGILLYGLATLQFGMAANGGLALAVTLLPALLRREYGYSMDAGLVLWITVAVFLHSVGSLGPYTWFPWYDSVTHTISATVIAGTGYAALRAFERHSDDIDVPSKFRAVFIVVFVLAAGVVWEILEFASGGLASITGTQAPLTVMGIDDIVSDMIFNTAGAVIVAAWGTCYVGGFVAFLGRRLRSESGD